MTVLDCSCGARVDATKRLKLGKPVVCPSCGRVLERIQGEQVADSRVSCAYCQAGIFAGARTHECPGCQQSYHAVCWDENGGCAVYGCSLAPKVDKGDLGEEWAQMEPCLSCGELIATGTRRCPHCDENLDHLRRQPTRQERREEKEKQTVLQHAFVVLALSLLPCLSPVMIVVSIAYLATKSKELASEPRAKVILASACIVSIIFSLLLVAAL